MDRSKVIAGNWKMYKTISESSEFIKELKPLVANQKKLIYLAVPFTALYSTVQSAKNSNLVIGAQNVSEHEEGAFTGEIAARMLKEAGAKFVIIGHSERRQYFHEQDHVVNKKVKKALEHQLQPLLCIGETQEMRESNKTEAVLKRQLLEGLHGIEGNQVASMIVAYEPIWAIGSGQHATPAIAEETQRFCRNVVAEKWGKSVADKLVILYGGSVKPDNAQELLKQPDIDGLLVGGASLSPQSFSQIIKG